MVRSLATRPAAGLLALLAAVTTASRRILDHVVQVVRAQGFTQVTLAGFTDRRASYRYNLALSNRRAQAVAKYLRQALASVGVSVSFSSYSYLNPAATNRTSAGRLLNRRTEIRLR